MSITKHKLKKWFKMIIGKSILHVNQEKGKYYSINEIKGYYNDLTEKVTKSKIKDTKQLPLSELDSGQKIIFPVAIFQYGLGSYDLYLKTNEQQYLERFETCVKWTVENQNCGKWDNFKDVYPSFPYGAMAQGEAISLLCRAYIFNKDPLYLGIIRNAVGFMLDDINIGGVTSYKEGIVLMEFQHLPAVLNGWIFAFWGLYDYLKVEKNEYIQNIFDKAIITLKNSLNKFDCGNWSYYDLSGKIASPFYHKLHIAQLEVMFDITNKDEFKFYANKWQKEYKNPFYKIKAFIKKARQKISEK